MTCDIVLGTAPTDAICATRLAGTAEVPAVAEDLTANPPVQAQAAIPAVPADTELTGKAGRRRRSIVKRETTSEYQESTGFSHKSFYYFTIVFRIFCNCRK